MNVIVLNTGTEILLGDVLNTHLRFIARQIFPLGLRVDRQLTVPDGAMISEALSSVLGQADIVFVTGGLGPTTDDVTREAAAGLLELRLRPDSAVLTAIRNRLANHGFKFTERISRQTEVPEGAVVLPNAHGTAPGLYLRAEINPRKNSPHLFLLPGPPRELEPMFVTSVLPLLRTIAPERSIECRTFHIAGIGESLVEAAIGEQVLAIPGIELGYCARPGQVDVRVVGAAAALERADAIISKAFETAIYSRGEEALDEVVVKLLSAQGAKLAAAESCTGGYLSHLITNVPGASAVFLAGYITYANSAKLEAVGVDATQIETHGAVSEPVARAMAEGARARSGATYGLATTGIAGPGGGSAGKPAGTVYIALAEEAATTVVKRCQFPTDRETFKQLAARAALEMLRQRLRANPRPAAG